MIASILVCTDGSPHANVACDYAFRIAKAFQASLKALHVLDVRMIEGPLLADISGAIGASGYFAAYTPFRDLTVEKGSAIENAFRESAAFQGVAAEFTQETGHPFHVILDHESHADLLIIGRRGENETFGRDLIGSVTDRLIRKTSKPCLVTPARPLPISRVLAACDGSPIANAVVQAAAGMATRFNAPLVLVTAVEHTERDQARNALISAEATAARNGKPPAKTILAGGQAADAILSAATEEKCDLIVMGAHSHARIREWFVGCTTLRVLADSALPALLVR